MQPPYSPIRRSGEWAFISGIVGTRDGALVQGGFDAELAQIFDNLDERLRAAGLGRHQVVKVTVFLADIDQWSALNDVYRRWFEGVELPARSVVAVAGLPRGACVELEATAHLPATEAQRQP